MNRHLLKKAVTGLGLALSLSFFIGIIAAPAVEAQNRDYRWQRDRDNRRDSDREWLRRMQEERAREIARARQRERERERAYRYGNRRNDSYYGNYGNYGGYGGYNSAEQQRGYRNGLKEGQDDARDRDSYNPNRHSSFRDGNPAYRHGFASGYQQGYRQYSYSRRY